MDWRQGDKILGRVAGWVVDLIWEDQIVCCMLIPAASLINLTWAAQICTNCANPCSKSTLSTLGNKYSLNIPVVLQWTLTLCCHFVIPDQNYFKGGGSGAACMRLPTKLRALHLL